MLGLDASDQAGIDAAAHRARRDDQQGGARGQRDPRRVARLRPRRGRVVRPAAVPIPRRGRRPDAARADVQHPQRRQARPGLHGLPGVHGHAGRRWRRSPRRCAPAPRSSARSGRSCTTRAMRPGRATRAGSRRRCRPTRPPSRSSCGPSRRPATGRASTSRSRSIRRRPNSSSRGPAPMARRPATSWPARAGRWIAASWWTCGPTGWRATRSSRSRTAWPRTTGPAGSTSPSGSAARSSSSATTCS